MPVQSKITRETAPAAPLPRQLHDAVIEPSKLWLGAPDIFLSAVAEWVERRREDLSAAKQAIQKLSSCKDAVEMAEVQQAFILDCASRWASGSSSLASGMLAFSQQSNELMTRMAEASGKAMTWVVQPTPAPAAAKAQHGARAAAARNREVVG